jgi:hypothetical protein
MFGKCKRRENPSKIKGFDRKLTLRIATAATPPGSLDFLLNSVATDF